VFAHCLEERVRGSGTLERLNSQSLALVLELNLLDSEIRSEFLERDQRSLFATDSLKKSSHFLDNFSVQVR